VEDIEFDRFHSIQIAFNDRDRYEAMPRVDQKSAPREA